MHRFRDGADARSVERVASTLPERIRDRLRAVRYVTGYDPGFLGIHHLTAGDDGRSYESTSHCAWPHNLLHRPADDRRVTVCLAGSDAHDPLIVLHELGHALDWALGWYRAPVRPLDPYAARSEAEAFATAFQAWATPHLAPGHLHFHDRRKLLLQDPRTAAFFERLATGT